MAKGYNDKVREGLDLLKQGLAPYVERELKSNEIDTSEFNFDDTSSILKAMQTYWNDVFNNTLGSAIRSYVHELVNVRNRWAHEDIFNGDDAYRALDTMERLLNAVSALEASNVNDIKIKVAVQKDKDYNSRIKKEFQQQFQYQGSLPAWREIIIPHPDVCRGTFQQAEFAADLYQVYQGGGASEYTDPREFFSRTFLTSSLRRILLNSVQRFTGQGGDPVIQLQTSFGGGKTHTMLALYHLYSGINPAELEGVGELLGEAGVSQLPAVKRVVIVGTRATPGSTMDKPDGVKVHTLWGEIAYQLGGREAYQLLEEDDRKATNPGDKLRALFETYGPCLILIDEWVAYARQLKDTPDLCGGSFETHFTFAQTLTEAAKASTKCQLVVSLPESNDLGGTRNDSDVEVGGPRGREALNRLRAAVGRVETSWQPATSEESFSIVQRRLFEPIDDEENLIKRNLVAEQFVKYYRTNKDDFPQYCTSSDYTDRIKASYPIHPMLFEFLYNEWSSNIKFQRTRGVLRLMALVINNLWNTNDKSPLIMPSVIPLDDDRIASELIRNLNDSETWRPIINKDIDGPNSCAFIIEKENSKYGQSLIARRLARTIFMGTAPHTEPANRGLDIKDIMLGCLIPEEKPVNFRDVLLTSLATRATYLFNTNNTKFWYQTQPNINRTAEDLTNEFLQNKKYKVYEFVQKKIDEEKKNCKSFQYIYPFVNSSEQVQDITDVGLVVLHLDNTYADKQENEAMKLIEQIINYQSKRAREYKNSLVFLAPDKSKQKDVFERVSEYLAWDYLLENKEEFNLDTTNIRNAEGRKALNLKNAERAIQDTYCWLIIPYQKEAGPDLDFETNKFNYNSNSSAQKSSFFDAIFNKLEKDEYILTRLSTTKLHEYIDKTPLWRGENHDYVSVNDLICDFAKYNYLPRLKNDKVIFQAIEDYFGQMVHEKYFAYADSYDENKKRFVNLRLPIGNPNISILKDGLLVKYDVAQAQFDRENVHQPTPTPTPGVVHATSEGAKSFKPEDKKSEDQLIGETKPIAKKFVGSVKIHPDSFSKQISAIFDNVIKHITSTEDVKDINLSLEISAVLPSSTPENIIRNIQENSNALKFDYSNIEDLY